MIYVSLSWWLCGPGNTLAIARGSFNCHQYSHAGKNVSCCLACICFEINFSGRQEGSAVSSVICDRWLITSSTLQTLI